MKVLVADDSTILRRLMKNALNENGVDDVVEAATGKEAVAAAAGDDVDLVLMDWTMPEATGLEAVRAIRESGSAVPIVMVVTEAERQRLVAAVRAGIDGYLVKPFTPESLVESVQQYAE